MSAKRYRYAGLERDEETGLDHMGARYYAPWLGRWTAADPIGLAGGINLYEYAASTPIRMVDPGGRAPRDPPNEARDEGPEARSVPDGAFVTDPEGTISEGVGPSIGGEAEHPSPRNQAEAAAVQRALADTVPEPPTAEELEQEALADLAERRRAAAAAAHADVARERALAKERAGTAAAATQGLGLASAYLDTLTGVLSFGALVREGTGPEEDEARQSITYALTGFVTVFLGRPRRGHGANSRGGREGGGAGGTGRGSGAGARRSYLQARRRVLQKLAKSRAATLTRAEKLLERARKAEDQAEAAVRSAEEQLEAGTAAGARGTQLDELSGAVRDAKAKHHARQRTTGFFERRAQEAADAMTRIAAELEVVESELLGIFR